MTHGSLFSGIGGFDLAAEWTGWENKFHCEINPFCQKVLKYHFPNSVGYEDIKKTDFTKWNGAIDIISGGFPCQPYSLAGKRKGKEDDRHLWPEMLRAIREIQPRWVLGENVLGLLNWDGGLVFHEVQTDLEAEGFIVFPYVFPACSVNAPHRRDRIWFVAYANSNGITTNTGLQRQAEHEQQTTGTEQLCESRINTNTGSIELQGRMHKNGTREAERYISTCNALTNERQTWNNFPTQSPIRTRNDGLSRQLSRYITKELYNEISKENRIENLPEVWERISEEEVWEQIRGFYSLESQSILFQTMQLYSTRTNTQDNLSPFCEKVSEPILQHLWKYGKFGCSPQGQELEKQRSEEFGNTLSFLSHEVALAARRFETAITKFDAWHRTESIKAYGNAVVPQVVYQIFKAIELFETI